MYYKTKFDSDDKACEAVHNYAVKYAQNSYNLGKDDGINIGKADGINIGKAYGITEGTVRILINLVNSGNITFDYAIAASGLDKQRFISVAESLGYKL